MSWSSISSSWYAVSQAVSDSWQSAYSAAEAAYADLVATEPDKAKAQVQQFEAELVSARGSLDHMKVKLSALPQTSENEDLRLKYDALDARYHEIGAGFYSDIAPANKSEFGVIPVLVIGTVALGMGAITWSFVGLEYVENLQQETALAQRELDARITASKEGRTLQVSTLPSPPTTKIDPTILMGGAAAIGGLLLFMKLR